MDRALEASATHALAWLIRVPGMSLLVAVEHRWVTLSGQVDWDYQRCAAIRATQHRICAIGVVSRHLGCRDVTDHRRAAGTNVDHTDSAIPAPQQRRQIGQLIGLGIGSAHQI